MRWWQRDTSAASDAFLELMERSVDQEDCSRGGESEASFDPLNNRSSLRSQSESGSGHNYSCDHDPRMDGNRKDKDGSAEVLDSGGRVALPVALAPTLRSGASPLPSSSSTRERAATAAAVVSASHGGQLNAA